MRALSTIRFWASAGLATAGLMASSGALAVVALQQTTFYFSGVCEDCTLTSPPSIGTLVLQNYTPGDAIGESNFIAFAYHGSNLVYSFTVTRDDTAPVLAIGNDFIFQLGSTDMVSGSIPAAGGAADFRIEFSDGIGFESTAAGGWFACAPGPAGFSSGSCNLFTHNDVGTGSWSTTAPVPEPASYALMGLGLLAVAALRRRTGG